MLLTLREAFNILILDYKKEIEAKFGEQTHKNWKRRSVSKEKRRSVLIDMGFKPIIKFGVVSWEAPVNKKNE